MNNKTEVQIPIKFWNHIAKQEWDKARLLLDDAFVAYWPQSKEKFNGPDNFIAVNRDYPGNHKIQVLTSTDSYDSWEHKTIVTTEVYIESLMPDNKEMKLFAISIFEIADEKIIELREYWAETYPAPEWRRHLVEVEK